MVQRHCTFAAEETNAELVVSLLQRGANPRKQDLNGLTALDCAALSVRSHNHSTRRFPAVAKLLLSMGQNLQFGAAVALTDLPRIRELINVSPHLLRRIDSHGGLLTPAVNHGKVEAVRLLLDLGADVDERIVLKEVEEPTPS